MLFYCCSPIVSLVAIFPYRDTRASDYTVTGCKHTSYLLCIFISSNGRKNKRWQRQGCRKETGHEVFLITGMENNKSIDMVHTVQQAGPSARQAADRLQTGGRYRQQTGKRRDTDRPYKATDRQNTCYRQEADRQKTGHTRRQTGRTHATDRRQTGR